MRHHAARLLVGLYPAEWRNEYGSELYHLLVARPIRFRAAVDVVLSAVTQQVAYGHAWRFTGAALLCYVLAQLAISILCPPAYENRGHSQWMFCLAFAVAGALTRKDSVEAALKTLAVGLWPLTLTGVLYASGVLGQVVLAPGDVPTTFAEHGWAFAVYHPEHRPMGAFPLIILPLFVTPYAVLFGGLGGLLVRKLSGPTVKQA